MTTCKVLKVEPSFKATKRLLRKARTHPFTVIVSPIFGAFKTSTISSIENFTIQNLPFYRIFLLGIVH